MDLIKSFKSEGEEWAEGRTPYLRAVLWIFFLYIFVRHLSNRDYGSIFSGINLGIHELGHVVLSFMPMFIMIAAGTIFQLMAPVASIFIFLRQNDYFAVSVSFGWLSTSLFEVARYSGDAERMLLPLVSPFGGEEIIHDWNYMLSKLGMLGLAPIVSGLFWLAAFLCMSAALLWGGYILLIMFKVVKPSKTSSYR